MRVGGTKARQIKCRIIAATNSNIEELIAKKLFREDLFHRLKQFSIYIPPLRERKEDIDELIYYFLHQQNAEHTQVLSNELMLKFHEYHWPGNIRELKNEIERIKILCGYKPIIESQDIDIAWLDKKPVAAEKSVANQINKKLENTSIQQVNESGFTKNLTFSDMRRQQLILLFQKYKKMTRGQIAQILQVNLLTVTKDLRRLCEEGVIIKKMPTKSPRSHYFEILSNN
jgi:transcriptional regulator with PAS, ATPase and Fis domain